jgi:hypothetical protein
VSSISVRTDATTSAVLLGLEAPLPSYVRFMTERYGDAVEFEHLYEVVPG